ncbi:MAG TPA: DUF350 domain-containing protein [Myxococcaceae bacterium]|nr:DUF350 domain-containing protein [Myxococcaceae bacterium]
MNTDNLVRGLLAAVVFSGLGLAVFVIGFHVIRKMFPFNVYKEIEEDQNVALAIVIGSFILGLAVIIAASLHG